MGGLLWPNSGRFDRSTPGGRELMTRAKTTTAVIAVALLALFVTVVQVAQSHGVGKQAPTGAHRASPSFADVAPIFNSKCTGCHMAGGIAPFSLTDPDQARTHAALIKIMTGTGAMPPWPPGRDSKPYVG